MKKLVLGNLFKLFRVAVTLAWEVCDTSQLIWIVQMMRLKGGKWASLVKHTWVLATWNLILPLWWTRHITRQREAGQSRTTLWCSTWVTPWSSQRKLPHPIVFCPCQQSLSTCGSLKMCYLRYEIDTTGHRWSAGGEELGQRMRSVWDNTCWLRDPQIQQCI